MTPRTRVTAALVVAGIAVGTAACSGSSSPATTPSGTTSGSGTPSPTPGAGSGPSAGPTLGATGPVGQRRTVVVATGTTLTVASTAPKGATTTPPGPNHQVAPPHEQYATLVVGLRNSSGSAQPVANVFDASTGDSTFVLAIPLKDQNAFGGYTCSDDLLPPHWCGLSTIVAAVSPPIRSSASIPPGGGVRLLLASTSPLQDHAPMQHVAVFVLRPGNKLGVRIPHP